MLPLEFIFTTVPSASKSFPDLLTITPMPEKQEVSKWIERAKAGDSLAEHQLWQHYYAKLIKATKSKLRSQQGGTFDEEDIVISVFESFYRAAEAGRFPDLTDRDDLWRLLLKMSARKIVDQQRRAGRTKRGGNKIIWTLGDARTQEDGFIELNGDEPTPEMVAMMAESFEQLLSHLGDGSLREIAVGKMEGYSNSELAAKYECSERTIERRLRLVREKCQQELLNDD